MNAMAMVDVVAIENQMKAASLDTLKGYNHNTFGTVLQGPPTEYVKKRDAKGYQLLKEPMWNQGLFCRANFFEIC